MSEFTDRECTAQEYAWLLAAGRGDIEAQMLLMEARRINPNFDVRSLPMSLFVDATDVCITELKKSSIVTRALVKQSRARKRGLREGKR